MLRVTLELVPLGMEAQKITIGGCTIRNDGTHPQGPLMANYVASIEEQGEEAQMVSVRNFRRADGSAWDLVAAVLREMERRR